MGSFRSVPSTAKHTSIKSWEKLTFAVSHMCGWRLYMEDAHIAVAPLKEGKNACFAVFDGHGGAEVAAFVERHFLQQLETNKNYLTKDYEQALRQTFMKMDDLLATPEGKAEISKIQKQMREKQNGAKYDEESNAGCTANVVLITPDYIYCANAGDSRSIASVKGQVFQLSKDHKPQNEGQLSRITRAGGSVVGGRVNGGLNLSRALGDLEYKKTLHLKPQQQMITANPDITKLKNQDIDFIIMGCDGIWQIKSNSQMLDYVNKKLTSNVNQQTILQNLLDDLVAKDSGNMYGMDNMSAILIKFGKK